MGFARCIIFRPSEQNQIQYCRCWGLSQEGLKKKKIGQIHNHIKRLWLLSISNLGAGEVLLEHLIRHEDYRFTY